ncbi:MAG: DNA repair protein RadC [Acidihalobacter sp.]|uniref:RadC family protein n=1 Tax=Acidihalobacter sp. TaxID=1872108 RepID=UPI00307D2765
MNQNPQQAIDFGAFVRDAQGRYQTARPVADDDVIELARQILDARVRKVDVMDSPGVASVYVMAKLAGHKSEVFSVLWLDNRHRVIAFEEMFNGTIDGCSVHPREVVRRALELNAAACMLAHNHPSGVAEPSMADVQITRKLKESLALIDVRVIDHLIVGGAEVTSMAERGQV